MKIYGINSKISFKRRLTPIETIENRVQTDDAKKAIGLNNIVLVTHTPSFPSSKEEDTGIGVMSLNKGAVSYINFAYNNGIDAVSIEPQGIIKADYYSPYDSSVLSKKPVVDLLALSGDYWANILDQDTVRNVVMGKNYNISVPVVRGGKTVARKQVELDHDRVIYDYAISKHNEALNIAFKNFKDKVKSKDKRALELNSEFMEFSVKNDYYLRGDSLYYALSKFYGNDYYPNWENPIHRTLFDYSDKLISREDKENEIKRLEKLFAYDIEFYKFSQFVVNKQQKDFTDYAMKLGIVSYDSDIKTVEEAYKKDQISKDKYEYLKKRLLAFKKSAKGVSIIGDKQIGYSSMDIWSIPSVFTKNEFLGAPPNLTKGHFGQDWNFQFIPWENLFNLDGSLGQGGIYLKKLMKKAFEDNPGGLRIDHILGMIDPWIYTANQNGEVSPIKFNTLLLTSLKGISKFGINQDTVAGLKDPIGAIRGDNNEERKILESRGVVDFDGANKILSDNENSIEKIKYANACTGKRYYFSLLLDGTLEPLKKLGFNDETISGVIDPTRAIFDPNSNDRKIMEQRGVKDFDKAAEIYLKNKDEILAHYSKVIQDIVLTAGFEVIQERNKALQLNMNDEEIKDKARSLLICEDLGALTMPLKQVMKDLGLIGLRDAMYSDPLDERHIYREINPDEQGNYWLIGSHDSPPYEKVLEGFSDEKREQNAKYISRELNIEIEPLLDKKNPFNFVRAKIARIFAADKNPDTPNYVLLNWLDLFASKKRYNFPGRLDKEHNWNLRVSSSDDSFERRYFEETLPSKRGINIPQALSVSLEAMGLDSKYKKLNDELKITAEKIEE